MNDQRIDLPAFALRVLHSGWVDWLTCQTQEGIRDAFLTRAGGLDFQRFLLALRARRFAVSVRVDADDCIIGLAVPASDGPDLAMFEMPPTQCGLRPEYVLALATVDLDEEIAHLLGSHS